MLKELVALTESPAGQKAARAEVSEESYMTTMNAAAGEMASGKKDS